jgi:hypothetical protein
VTRSLLSFVSIRMPRPFGVAVFGLLLLVFAAFDIVQTNSTTYFSGPIGDTWRVVPPESLPFDFIGMNTSVATALANASGITVAPGEQVKGKHMFLLSGAIVSDDLQGLVPGAASGLPLTIECWIGQEDGLPWKVVLTGALISSDPETMVRQLDLNAFDEPVTVEAPI